MAIYTGHNVERKAATRIHDSSLASPGQITDARKLEALASGHRLSEATLIQPAPLVGAHRDSRRQATRQSVTGFIHPPRFAAVLHQPLRRAASLRENFILKGTLRDALDRPLGGWFLIIGAGIHDPEADATAVVAARLTGTDEAGAFSTVLQRTNIYVGIAWKEGEHVIPLACEIAAFDGLNSVDFRAPIQFHEGRAFIANTTNLLRKVRLAWTDPASKKAWQGTQTDAEGRYGLYEEQRAYEIFAIQTAVNSRALYALSDIVDNADGTRDLHFLLLASSGASVEFAGYTGGFVKKYAADGTYQNLPPEWNFGGP